MCNWFYCILSRLIGQEYIVANHDILRSIGSYSEDQEI